MTQTVVINNPSPKVMQFIEKMREMKQEQLKKLAETNCKVKILVE